MQFYLYIEYEPNPDQPDGQTAFERLEAATMEEAVEEVKERDVLGCKLMPEHGRHVEGYFKDGEWHDCRIRWDKWSKRWCHDVADLKILAVADLLESDVDEWVSAKTAEFDERMRRYELEQKREQLQALKAELGEA